MVTIVKALYKVGQTNLLIILSILRLLNVMRINNCIGNIGIGTGVIIILLHISIYL